MTPRRSLHAGVRQWLVTATLIVYLSAAGMTAAQPPVATLDPTVQQQIETLFQGLDEHPALLATGASVAAARTELDGLRFPISIQAQVNANRPFVSAPDGTAESVIEEAEAWSTSASIRAVLRPFLLGDLADAERQRRVSLVQAERRARETRASLEAASLQAAAGLVLAEQGLRIAEVGLLLAQEAETATAIRIDRGAARSVDGERARLEVARAGEALRSAQRRVALAEARLADLVGPGVRLDSLPDPASLPILPPALAPDPAVVQAELDRTLAQIGLSSAGRSLLPTANVAYTLNGADASVSVALETRTFQPTVSVDLPSGVTSPPGSPVDIESVISVGLSYEFGGDVVGSVSAAQARLAAAEAAIVSAERSAALAAADREEARAAARAEAAFARIDLDLAERNAEEVRTQRELGLATTLDVLRADLARLQADLGVLNADISLLDATLADYRDLAIPLSEVLP